MGATRRMVVITNDAVVEDKQKLQTTLNSVVKGIWSDFKTTNQATAGKAMKFAAGVAVGGAVAKPLESLTPLQWMLRGFGPLPAEFTRSGAIQVFEFTTLERALLVAKAAAAKFVLVTIAYEGPAYSPIPRSPVGCFNASSIQVMAA
jgi:hypothetical protein